MPSRFEYERAVRASDLPPLSRLLTLTLATWADVKTGIIPDRLSPSLSTLEEATGMDRSTVRRHLNKVETAGWVVRNRPDPAAARAKKARTRYRITVPKGIEVPESDGYEVGAENAETRGTQPLVDSELGAHSPLPRGTQPLELGAENPITRGTVPPKSYYGPDTSGEYHHPREPANLPATRTAAEADGHPAWLIPLMDAIGAAGINVPWKFIGDDMARVHNDIKRVGIPLMAEHAIDAARGSKTRPFSSRFFYDGWHALRPRATAPNGRPSLHAVDSSPKTSSYLADMAAIADELRQNGTDA